MTEPRERVYMSMGANCEYEYLLVQLNKDRDSIHVHTGMGMLGLPIDYARRLAEGLAKALAQYDAAQSDSWYDIPVHLHPGGVT